MPNSIGSMLLPVPVPTAVDASLGDPGLDVVADFFSTTLSADVKAAWSSRVQGEPVVRELYKHDPSECDFTTRDLPLLCCWSADDTQPSPETDESNVTGFMLRVLWVPPPAEHPKQSSRHPFFAAFRRSMAHAVATGRHRSWIHASEVNSVEAQAYGSSVLKHAGFDRWFLRRVERIPVVVPVARSESYTFPGYQASIEAIETTRLDPTVYGVEPFGIQLDLKSQALAVDEETTLDPINRFTIRDPATPES